jgi:hypothetical protein
MALKKVISGYKKVYSTPGETLPVAKKQKNRSIRRGDYPFSLYRPLGRKKRAKRSSSPLFL